MQSVENSQITLASSPSKGSVSPEPLEPSHHIGLYIPFFQMGIKRICEHRYNQLISFSQGGA